VRALAGRDSSLLPSLWPLLSSPDRSRREAGRRILAGLALDPASLDRLVAEHASAGPLRRGAIEEHLRASARDAADLLAARLEGPNSSINPFDVLVLHHAVTCEGTPS
ncbi:MAG: hypothetical protein HY720_12930, partial [Planctomycetes bacterium]|nr:hypothetical protein [Planctomycetota bacterium]